MPKVLVDHWGRRVNPRLKCAYNRQEIMPKKENLDPAVLAEPIEFMKTPRTKDELEQAFVKTKK